MKKALIVLSALAATVAAFAVVGHASTDDPIILGDANCDRRLNSIDANVVLQFEAALVDDICGNAEINGDGAVNSLDAQLILQLMLGLAPSPTLTPTPALFTSEFFINGLRPSCCRENALPVGFGEPLVMERRITNATNGPITRSYPTGQLYDFHVSEALLGRGLKPAAIFWRWSDGMSFPEVLSSQTWAAGQTTTYEAVWTQLNSQGEQVAQGRYILGGGDLGCTEDPHVCEDGTGADGLISVLPPEDPCSTDGFEARLRFDADDHAFARGEQISFRLTVTNCADEALTRQFGPPLSDFWVRDENGAEVWRWSHGMLFLAAIFEQGFPSGDVTSFTRTWDQEDNDGIQVPPGKYTLIGQFTGGNITAPRQSHMEDEQTFEIVP